MSRFADDRATDPLIILPTGEKGRDLRRRLFHAADTEIIKVRDINPKRQNKRLCLASSLLMAVVVALSTVIVALVVLILKA